MHADTKVKRARDAFPVTRHCTYLGTGSYGPVSSVYEDALRACADEDLRAGRALPQRYEKLARSKERLRRELASLLGVLPEEIVLTQGTGDALRTVTEQIPWRQGDEAICTQLEHEACSAPLQALARSGRITLRVAQVPVESTDDIRWLTDLLGPRTRLVAFPAIAFATGLRLPIARIAQTVRMHGAQSLLDAAQGAGAVALDLASSPVDFCALPLQKWLCGPEGLGALVARAGSGLEAGGDRVTRAWGAFESTAAHLQWLRTELGWAWIHERTLRLAAHARRSAAAVPELRVLTPAAHGGLVTLVPANDHAGALATRLHGEGFVFRYIEAMNAFRISTAFFNTENEIDRFYAALGEGRDA